MEEDAECAWRSAQRAGPSSEHVAPDLSICHQEVPKGSCFSHVAPASSSDKNVAPGRSCSNCLVPALLMVLLLMCAALQSVLIFIKISGTREDGFVTSNFSDLKRSLLKQKLDKCLEFLLDTNQTKLGQCSRCLDPWIPIHDKCYFFSENKKIHSLSAKDCAERDSRLAQVKEKIIQRLVVITGKGFWIGLTQFSRHGGVWRGKWTDGGMETVTEGAGSCAALGSHLTLENCYVELNYICERDAE